MISWNYVCVLFKFVQNHQKYLYNEMSVFAQVVQQVTMGHVFNNQAQWLTLATAADNTDNVWVNTDLLHQWHLLQKILLLNLSSKIWIEIRLIKHCMGIEILTLCYWPIYIREREWEEEVASGDPTSLPWPIWKLSCDWSVDTKTNMADTTRVTKHFKTNAIYCMK